MKLSYTTLSVKERSLEEAVAIAKSHHLDGIELRGMGNSHISAESSFSYIRDAIHLLKDSGLEVPCLTSYEHLAQIDGKGAGKEADSLLHTIDLASFIGAGNVRVFMGALPPGVEMEAVMDNVHSIMERTADSPVGIIIETHDSAQDGRTLSRILDGAPGCYGVLWDIIHPWMMGEDFRATWRCIGSRVRHMHIKDVRTRPEGGFYDYTAIGDGIIPVSSIVRHVLENGYDGFFSLEWERSSPGAEGISFEDQLGLYADFMRSLG